MKEQPVASSEFARGVDISAAHSAFDWRTAAGAGLKFGYLLDCRGTAEERGHLEKNWRAMKDAGILRGLCHYLRPLKEPDSEARRFCDLLQSLGGPELPPALRVKTVPTQTGMNEWDILRVDRRIEIVLRWLEVLEQACGRKCVLSTNGAFLQRTLGSGAALAGYDLWIADYRTAAPPAAPSPWNRWTFWRYSESGDFPGLTGRVSLNYFNGSRAELDKYASVQTAAVTETPAAVEPAPGQPLEPVPPIAGSDTGTEGPPAPSDAAEPEPAAQDDRGPTDAGEPSRRTRRAARREGGQGT